MESLAPSYGQIVRNSGGAAWDRGEETLQKLASLGGWGNKKFATDTASVIGDNKSSINQKITRARELGDDIQRVAGTSLDKRAELAMHTENLERASLSPAEEAYALSRAKALCEDIHEQARHGGDRGNQHTGGKVASGQNGQLPAPCFTDVMSATAGKSERTLQREVGIAEDLGDDILKVAGTSLRRSAGRGSMLNSG